MKANNTSRISILCALRQFTHLKSKTLPREQEIQKSHQSKQTQNIDEM